ncbi:MAG: hypothetical protein ACK4HW_13135 [Roseinatronobacter sp.]
MTALVLLLTATEDTGLDGMTPTDPAQVLDLIPAGRKRLAMIAGADHMELGGRRASSEAQVAGRIAAEFLTQLRTGFGPSQLALPADLALIRDR